MLFFNYLQNKDSEFDKLYTPKPKKSYHHSTLHYKISKCDPTIGIVGKFKAEIRFVLRFTHYCHKRLS